MQVIDLETLDHICHLQVEVEHMKKILLLLLGVSGFAYSGSGGFSVKARYNIPGTATWDYVTYNDASHRLYVAHQTRVEVMDVRSGLIVGKVIGTPGVHGIAIADDLSRGFTSNGGDDTVTIFDVNTLATIGKVQVGSRPDRIFYDALSQRVFTCNHGSGDITAMDAKTGSVLGVIRIEGGGEQLVPAPDHFVYVANADTSEVVTFDPRSLKVVRRLPLVSGIEPHGLAFDPEHHRLFAACRNKVMVVLDSDDGHVVTSLPIGETVDMAAFDPKSGLVFASNGDGTLSSYRQINANEYKNVGPIKTGPNAKQMDFDASSGRLFLPTGAIVTSGTAADGKPAKIVKDGTFAILVVGR